MKALNKKGFFLKIYKEFKEDICECDIIFIDSKFYKFFWSDENKLRLMFRHLNLIRKKVKKIFYFDTTDSSGCLQNEIFDYVDIYYKSQLLKDRNKYKYKLYGGRVFTDYYNKRFGINDKEIIWQQPLSDKQIKKLKIFWNSCFANYTFLGKLLMFFSKSLNNYKLLKYPRMKYIPSLKRPNDFIYKGNFNYSRNTVSWQRTEIFKIVHSEIDTKRLNIYSYYKLLEKTKILISPFGWGEINYKDYEAFIYGNLLYKTDISHIETWPDLFIKNKTYIPFRWDLKNFNLNSLKNKFEQFAIIAKEGQKHYFQYLKDKENLFIKRFIKICKK